MSQQETLARFNAIINRLKSSPATYADISRRLQLDSEIHGFDFNTSKRTFQRDLNSIRTLYNIDIQYDYSNKRYFIHQEDSSVVNDRILEAFNTFNALNIADRLSNSIHFENRRPQATENLFGLMHAIKNSLQIKFNYQKFDDSDIRLRVVEPYALKEFKNRWYLIAKDVKDSVIKSFALDSRLSDLEISKKKFLLPDDFSLNDRFHNCFGIISPNAEQPSTIRLRFDAEQGEYIKTLPLHHTQKIVKDDDIELIVELHLYITHDLIMEILSYGYRLTVLEPINLRNDLKLIYEKALANCVG